MGKRGPLPRGKLGLRRRAKRVLRALSVLGEASPPEIARRAKMSPELVRYHLLRKDGLLARRYVRVTREVTARFRGRERAFRRFALTERGQRVLARPPPT